MKSNYDECLRRILIHEGGYSNIPTDPGGPTNFGITLRDYQLYINPNGVARDVQNMTIAQAAAIYRAHYADPLRFDELPSGVDYAIEDYGINSGIVRSAKVLRNIVGLSAANQVDDVCIAYARARDPKVLVAAICDERLSYLQSLHTFPTFGRGWTSRVNEVKAYALYLAGQSQAIITPANLPVATALPWMQRLNALLGLYEFPGAADNPAIIAMARACGGNIARIYKHDATAWCALTENYILTSSGFPNNGSLWALDFRKYGVKLKGPCIGAIATKTRDGGGHVFNVVGRTADGHIVGRGGNQSDMVCDELFDPAICEFNWPATYPPPAIVGLNSLPIVAPMPKVHREFPALPPLTAIPTAEMGKGTPQAPAIGKTVTTLGGGGALATGGLWDTIQAHPGIASAVVIGVTVATTAAVYAAWRSHQTHKTEPMKVVPVLV